MKAILVIVISLVIAAASAQQCDYSSICSDHTMCIYSGFGPQCSNNVKFRELSEEDKQAVLDIHNKLRRKVAVGNETRGNPGPQPPAANMCELQWDDELAKVAQRWADQCSFGHDSCRNVARFGWVGQNVYQSSSWGSPETGDQDWKTVVKAWFNEVVDFNKGHIDPFQFTSGIGHYTQVVWANTKKVGCGFLAYRNSNGWFVKYYVCNYGPGGNVVGGGTAMYKVGTACSECPGSCNNGLCLCV